MAGERDEKNTDNKSGGKKQPPLDDYDRLVQGCEEFYFGPGAEPEGEKKPTPKTTDEGSPKEAADEG